MTTYAYDPKQGKWLSKQNYLAYDRNQRRWRPELGFVDLQPITGRLCGGIDKVMEGIRGPWCVIDNVIFTRDVDDKRYKWYSTTHRAWLRVKGLDVLSIDYYHTIQLVNYGGKLLILCHKWINIVDGGRLIRSEDKNIWCAVIRLEKRMTFRMGPEMWAEVEHCNVVVPSVHKSCKLSSCQSVSV